MRRTPIVIPVMDMQMIKTTLLWHGAAMLVCGFMACGTAMAADTPETLSGTRLVSAEDVAKARAAGTAVVDTRVAAEYAEGHIAGATNVPYREKSAKDPGFDASQDDFAVAKLPPDKAAPLVLYCNGPECWKSYKAATAAMKAGYTHILWYRGGFPDWKAKGLPIE
jgi:rhodanese-related sulfurtransferase